jgi:hypothetical protein
MPSLRFATARAVFEQYPSARERINTPSTDELPADFARRLVAQGKFEDAIAFCAFLLARREAVWWGCRSLRTLLGDAAGMAADGLQAAEAWAQRPDEGGRLAARDVAGRGHYDNPKTWLAFAAAWSGGSISPNQNYPVPVPPYLTAHMIRIAIFLGPRLVKVPERGPRLRACVEDGIQISEFGL